MSDAHSPGPWRWVLVGSQGEELADPGPDVTWGRLDAPGDRVVMVAEGPVIPSSSDAALIAAAPETRDMLKETLATLAHLWETVRHDTHDDTKKAVEKTIDGARALLARLPPAPTP